MRSFVHLYRNGSSTVVCLTRGICAQLGWLPGQLVTVELLEDKSVRVRVPEARDFRPLTPPPLHVEPVAEHKP